MSEPNLKRYAFTGLAVVSAGTFVLKALSVLSTFIILHYLAPYDYGLWRLLISALSVASLLNFSSLSGLLVADISRELGGGRRGVARHILRRALVFFVVSGLCVATVFFLSAPVVTHVSKIDLTFYLQVLSITVIASAVRKLYDIIFQAYLMPVWAQSLSFVGSLSYLVGIALFVVTMPFGLKGLVYAYALSAVVPVVLFLPALISKLTRKPGEDEANGSYSFRDAIWTRGRWTIAEDYATTFVSSLWPWIAGYLLSISAVGIMSIAVLLVSQVTSLIPVQYVLRSVLPRLAAQSANVETWLMRAMRYSMAVQLIIAIGVLGVAQVVFPWLFPTYATALPLYTFLILAIPFRAGSTVLTEWYYTYKRQRQFFFINVLPKVSLILLPMLLISIGMFGFGAWFIFDSAVVYFFSLSMIKGETGINLLHLRLLLPDATDVAFFRSLWRRVVVRQGIERGL